MDDSNNRWLVIMTIQQFCDIIFSSSPDDSENGSNKFNYVQSVETKTAVPQFQNYVEIIIPQFKLHFRLEVF